LARVICSVAHGICRLARVICRVARVIFRVTRVISRMARGTCRAPRFPLCQPSASPVTAQTTKPLRPPNKMYPQKTINSVTLSTVYSGSP
jgi:hypothetical protein